jgi:hypothetical protein
MKIKCRNCGDNHLTIQCPLRSPDCRAKSWKQLQETFELEEQSKKYHCFIPIHPGKKALVHANSGFRPFDVS